MLPMIPKRVCAFMSGDIQPIPGSPQFKGPDVVKKTIRRDAVQTRTGNGKALGQGVNTSTFNNIPSVPARQTVHPTM
jgi:hypothetical protein